MDTFLKKMAQDLDFDVVEPESRVFGNGRIDQLWKRGDFEITIEHENDYSGVDNEIRKLCKNKSDLKVLITYVEDEVFVHVLRTSPNGLKTKSVEETTFC